MMMVMVGMWVILQTWPLGASAVWGSGFLTDSLWKSVRHTDTSQKALQTTANQAHKQKSTNKKCVGRRYFTWTSEAVHNGSTKCSVVLTGYWQDGFACRSAKMRVFCCIEISNNDAHKILGPGCQVRDLNLRMSRIFSMIPEIGSFLPTNLSWS